VHVTYAAPATTEPVGPLRGAAFSGVLPSGRITNPLGTLLNLGADGASAIALAPGGRFAVVAGPGGVTAVDTDGMTSLSRGAAGTAAFGPAVAIVADPRRPGRDLVAVAGGIPNGISLFDLDALGALTPHTPRSVALPPVAGAPLGSVPDALVAGAGGTRLYAVDPAGAVDTIDLQRAAASGPAHLVGFQPFGVAISADSLLVTNAGLERPLAQPVSTTTPPDFRTAYADPLHASSLSLLAIGPSGDLSAPGSNDSAFGPGALSMDPTPDGVRVVGGAQPTAIVATPDHAYAYVAMSGVDRIATVALGANAHVVGGTELRLFDKGPYGTQPLALALSRDGSRLYVALAGIDAVAVIDARDPLHLHRLGLIATGWDPTALALAPDDRTLYIINARSASLQRVELASVKLLDATRATLAATRRVVSTAAALPTLTNVVLVESGPANFDGIFGDVVPPADPDPTLVTAGAAVTPNLHALAQRFALAANYYADGMTRRDDEALLFGGLETVAGARAATALDAPLPDAYPRLGYLFDALRRREISYRDYGALLTREPALPALEDAYDPDYPAGFRASDGERATEFVRDYTALAGAHRQPRYAAVRLAGTNAGDADAAIGQIVAAISHLPAWRRTAIIVVGAGPGMGRDHIDGSHGYALLVSPFARRGYVSQQHLATESVLKTEDELLGIAPLALGDLLATDFRDLFATKADPHPYEAASGAGTNQNGS
jgi:DNA-binding beta-propeller fold protein YncE